ncbi:hypothetical protein COL5a_008424 [Colletotrichum fioriniae]|uniref:uncharacterized protein n=1 Tax=Colletotrichum fioriniae TaxID=710243 RepID=UPI0032DAEDEF|nr:hypothetical protein COL5a_008424 [Colletotrichum fioriniae]KAJ3944281.1 hypothetical protein N0V96_005807 [Colletotrichum fioriniae]
MDGVGLPVAGGVAAAPVTDPVGQYPVVAVPAPAPAPVPGTATTKNGTVSVTRSAPSAPHPAHEATVVVIGTLTAAGCIPSPPPPQYLLQPGTRIVVQCSAGVRRAASVEQMVVVISAAEALSKKLWNPVPEPKQPRYAYSPIVAGSRPGTTGSVEGLGGAVAVGPTTVDRTTDETWEDCTVAVDTMTVPFCVKLVTMVAGFGTVV